MRGACAAVLVEMGVKPGDRVIQVSENRYEWIVFDVAVHMAHAIHVAVHSTLTGPQIAFQIEDSGAKLVVISGPEQAQKLAAAAAHLPDGVKYLSYDPCDDKVNGQPVGLLPALLENASEAKGQAIEQRALAETQPSDLATILYTSGTTGDPKGVMLSHRNLTFNARAVLEIFKVEPHEMRLTWLPLSHIYARTSDLYLWIAAGGEIALSPSRDTIIADCQVLKPHYINGVPYFYDKVMRTLQEKGVADQPGVLAATFGGRIKMALRRRRRPARLRQRLLRKARPAAGARLRPDGEFAGDQHRHARTPSHWHRGPADTRHRSEDRR